jgi:hypothetical protein
MPAMRQPLRTLLPLLALGLLFFAACKDDEPLPHNPYDDVDYTDPGDGPYIPDPNGIVGIYENILRVKCANPGCHDGHFEPDFRSVQSAWSTLAYHRLVKNTADSAYTFRVVPGDTGKSIFWHRITRGDAQLQQMPATGNYLTATERQQVMNWILGGAKDMFGNAPRLPNDEPAILGFLAYNSTFNVQLDVTENRLDSVPYNPFKVADNTSFNMLFLLEDDSTATPNLLVNQLRLSLQMDNFSGATTVNAYNVTLAGYNVWVAPVNTAAYTPGDTVFMRYYVNDGDHAFNTEFPRDDLPFPYKTYASFFVTP